MADFSINQEPLIDDNARTGSQDSGNAFQNQALHMRNDLHSEGEMSEGDSPDIRKQETLTQRTTRSISRTLPIFAEIIIITFYLFVLGIFMYYAYIYQNDNTDDCVANAQSTKPIDNNTTVGVNVTKKFQMAIRFGFWLAVINLGRAVMAQAAIQFNNLTMQYVSYLVQGINAVLMITLFVFMQIWRWDNAGKVCSGVDLPANSINNGKYLLAEGQFLKWVIIVSYLLLSFGLVGGCCIALFFTKKHEAIGLFKEGGLFYERVKPSWQVNVEVNDGLAVDKTQMRELKSQKTD